jgi:hypothetical protein
MEDVLLKAGLMAYVLAFGLIPPHAEFITLHWLVPVALLGAVGLLTAGADLGTGVAAGVAVALIAGRSDGL